MALNKAYGLPIHDGSVDGLEHSLKRCGYVAVPFNQARAGDVIIAHRAPGEAGHAAIYMGNGKVANNSSYKRRIAIQDADKFYEPDYRSVVAYRMMA